MRNSKLTLPVPDSPALKSSPSKRGRGSLALPKYTGPGAAWSASQLPSERDENIYDLRGARSFPVLEDEGEDGCDVINAY